MEEFPTVSWRELRGNKYHRALHPAMLTDNGYSVTVKAKTLESNIYPTKFVVLKYDRDYVKSWLTTKVIKPLANYGLINTSKLLKESWRESRISYEPLARETR